MKQKKIFFRFFLIVVGFCFSMNTFSQLALEPGDPPKQTDIPNFFKSKLADIDAEIALMKQGKAQILTSSPGGLPVYGIFYGTKENLHKQANYNSAVGARNPAFFATKNEQTKPVIFFIGPVHGQEPEGIAGLVNLIHIAETGKDYKGKEWPEIREYFNRFRVIIIPCGNPDGRKRCPYDSFVGLPSETMTKYGQGTKKDGTLWGWPLVKSLHPMKGDIGIPGAYFNDNGINIMHDEFFSPMAEETKAIFRIAMEEAPDITVSLHSCECKPFIIQNNQAPHFMRQRISDFANGLNRRYIDLKMPNMGADWSLEILDDDMTAPPQTSFNLVSALHYASGTMSMVFECPQGTIEDGATYNEILDVQLVLYQEMFNYIENNRLYWK
jgi:hypothetical protein